MSLGMFATVRIVVTIWSRLKGSVVMPSKTEAGCVLTPANRYDSFRRDNCAAKVGGKCLDHVYGFNDDGSELHSLRYRFSVGWTNAAAKTHCSEREGDFEAGSEENMKRTRTKYLYAPMLQKGLDSDGSKMVVRYAFTSDKMDEGGDVITKAATEKATEAWRSWRNIRMQHDPTKPIGKAVGIGAKDGLNWNEMDVRIDDPSVLPLVEGDDPTLGGASVGIIVNEFEANDDEEAIARSAWKEPWIINDYTIVEISLVDHPMNYDAKFVGETTESGRGRGRVLMLLRDLEDDPEQSIDVPEMEQEDKMADTLDAPLEGKEEKDLEITTENAEVLEPDVSNEVLSEDIKQEGGDPDPTLALLSEINTKLDVLTGLAEDIHKSLSPAEEKSEEVEPVEEAPVTEVAPVVEESSVDAVPDLAEKVERIYKHLFGGETEGAKVDPPQPVDVAKMVAELFDKRMEDMKKLSPRVSVAVEPDVPEVKPEETKLNPREALYNRVRTQFNNRQ